MKSKNGYWKRQVYMLSSIGLFYILILAFFAIPLLGTFVVILIQGAIDFRYLILAVGCLGLIVLIVFMIKFARNIWQKFQKERFVADEDIRRHLLSGKPVEISFLNGLFTFRSGQENSDAPIGLPPGAPILLPHETGQNDISGILDQLQALSELKQSGAIDADEYNQLKTMIIESSATSDTVEGGEPQ